MATARARARGARGRRTRARWSRPADVEAANETSVEVVNATVVEAAVETAAEAAIETRMQSIEADFVTARERHTKKAAEVETNAHVGDLERSWEITGG